MSGTKSPSAVGKFEKVSPNLYRHSLSGRYYGVKKFHGKRKEHSLKTADRKIAERRLKEWVDNLSKVDSEVEKTILLQLLKTFESTYLGKSESTRENNGYIVKRFKKTWRPGLQIQVRDIRPSQLDEWLASFEASVRHTTYNRYVGFLRQIFDIAVKDRIIAESPVEKLATKWKNPQTPIRRVPTIEQFEAIIACVRGQKHNDHAEDTGDFLEFLGLAGLGQGILSTSAPAPIAADTPPDEKQINALFQALAQRRTDKTVFFKRSRMVDKPMIMSADEDPQQLVATVFEISKPKLTIKADKLTDADKLDGLQGRAQVGVGVEAYRVVSITPPPTRYTQFTDGTWIDGINGENFNMVAVRKNGQWDLVTDFVKP